MSFLSRDLLKRAGLSVLCWLPALVPPLLIFVWMRSYLLNVPFMDDYVWLPFYEKMAKGTFTTQDFFFVQMEHRLTVPAFLTWVFFHIRPGYILLQNWTSFTLLCLTGWNLLYLLRKSLPDLQPRWLIAGACSLALFSPTQSSTLLWADCFSSYMPLAFLTGVFAVFYSGLRCWPKFICCLVLAELGTVSFASGVLIWPLLAPLILWTGIIPEKRNRWIFLAVWIVAMVVTMGCYFHNLKNQALPLFSYEQAQEVTLGKHLHDCLERPWQTLQFVLIFCGASLGRGTYATMQDATFIMGVVLVLTLLAACVPLFRKNGGAVLRNQTLPWVMVGAYTLLTGLMVAMGREYARKSMDGALWNRYTIHSMLMVIAVIVLVSAWWRRIVNRVDSVWRQHVVFAAPVVFGAFIMLLLTGWIYGQHTMIAWWSSRLRDATCQFFAKVLPDHAIEGPLIRRAQPLAIKMDDLGLLSPAMTKSSNLDQFVLRGPVKEGTAELEAVDVVEDRVFKAAGTAYLYGQSRPADGVLFCYKDEESRWIIFEVGQVMSPPLFLRFAIEPDLQYLHQPSPSPRHNHASFDIRFRASQLPAGIHEVAAWTFDFSKRVAYRMAGLYRVDTEKNTVEKVNERSDGGGKTRP
ncbi:MAG: hypothetical protein WCN98_10205 [Verrucomicrobiaceae bacterium]